MSPRHVFEHIKTVVRDRGDTWITLMDGTKIGLPRTAQKHAEPVKPRMKVLLDLEDWNPVNGLARLYVYDRHHTIMTCGMGADGCIIESPALA